MTKIHFISANGEEHRVDVAPGLSVMQAATSQGIPGIDAECGGSLSCATCHVYVEPGWLEHLPAPSEQELMMLEFAEAPNATSRLSCQLKIRQDLDGLVVHIPESQ